MVRRWLAGQFARPAGWLGGWLIGPWLDRLSGRMNAVALEQLAVRPGERVLEAGYGGGALLAALLDAGAEVVGIDPSEAMLARARCRFAAELKAGRLNLFEGSAQRLPVPDAAVDKACSVNNLYFWPDPAAALAELARVIRPGGVLAIAFEPPDELRKWPGHRFGFRLYDEAELRTLMAAAGFGALRCREGRGRRPDRFLCLTGERAGGQATA